jgi:hypothetical protein
MLRGPQGETRPTDTVANATREIEEDMDDSGAAAGPRDERSYHPSAERRSCALRRSGVGREIG